MNKLTVLITASGLDEKAHESLLLTIKTLEAKINESCALLISSARTKVNAAGIVSDAQTVESLKKLIQSFIQTMEEK